MRMTGSWHLYRVGERWRKPSAQLRVALTTDDWVAACFNAPVVETYRVFDRSRHPGFGRLGPDLCQADANLKTCVDLIVNYPQLDEPIGEVLLDQHVMCGVGNVYRSEILWACSVSPFHPVGDLDEDTIRRLVATGARQLRANLSHSHRITTSDVPGGLAVYGRNGQRCTRCGDTVQVRRTGPFQRVVYWCPGCQVLAPVEADISDEREMDPHPAAAKYLAELPWRRHDQVAG
jgi:endonuclease-8